MNDKYQIDYSDLKDLEKILVQDIKKRKDMGSSTAENTVRLEQTIFKALDNFGKRVDMAIKGYTNKYRDIKDNQMEANGRINKLNDLLQSHSNLKKSYDGIINDKYQYVSLFKFILNFINIYRIEI